MYSEWWLLDCNERRQPTRSAPRSPGDFMCTLFLLLATVAAGANDCNNANRLQSLVEHFRFHSIWLYALHPKWNPTPQPNHIFFVVFFFLAIWFGAHCDRPVYWAMRFSFQPVLLPNVCKQISNLIRFGTTLCGAISWRFSLYFRKSTACAFWFGEKMNSANAIGSRWRDFRIKSNFRLFAFNAKHFYLTRFAIVCRSLTRILRRENYHICAMLIHETAK